MCAGVSTPSFVSFCARFASSICPASAPTPILLVATEADSPTFFIRSMSPMAVSFPLARVPARADSTARGQTDGRAAQRAHRSLTTERLARRNGAGRRPRADAEPVEVGVGGGRRADHPVVAVDQLHLLRGLQVRRSAVRGPEVERR